ncbi:MAG: DUF2877 domain-containing protein [Anaerolineae bacterium]
MAILDRPNRTTAHLNNLDDAEDGILADEGTAPPGVWGDASPILDPDTTDAQRRAAYRSPTRFHSHVLATSTSAVAKIERGRRAKPVARFRRAVNLVTETGLIAAVKPQLGKGPFHVVVDELPPDGTLRRPMPIRQTPDCICIGPWMLHLSSHTEIWDPRPPWESIDLKEDRITELRTLGTAAARAHRATSPFIPLLLGETAPYVDELSELLALDTQPTSDFTKLISSIAGLGPGLTPAGDDFLAGLIFALWSVHHPRAADLGAEICRTAAVRTTLLSRAYLEAASQGYADEKWHGLLHALTHGARSELERAAASVVSFGATSGLDTLSGFLWTLSTAKMTMTDD